MDDVRDEDDFGRLPMPESIPGEGLVAQAYFAAEDRVGEVVPHLVAADTFQAHVEKEVEGYLLVMGAVQNARRFLCLYGPRRRKLKDGEAGTDEEKLMGKLVERRRFPYGGPQPWELLVYDRARRILEQAVARAEEGSGG